MSHWFVSAKGWIHRGWLALRVFFFSYLEWINNSDEIFVGRVISRQVEYQEVYQSQKGDQNYYRFGAFSACWKKRRVFIHEKEMTISYFAKNMLPRFKVSCRKLCPRSFQRRLSRRLKEKLRSLRVLYTSPVYYPIIILLSFNFQSNMLSSLCGFSFCNTTIVVVLYVCRTSV